MPDDFDCVWMERKGHCTTRGPDRMLGVPTYCSTGFRGTISDAEPRRAAVRQRPEKDMRLRGSNGDIPPMPSWELMVQSGCCGLSPPSSQPQGLASVLGKTGEEGSVLQLRAGSCFSVHARPSALPLGRHQLARKSLVLGRALVGKVPETREKLQSELTLKQSTAKGPAAPLAVTVIWANLITKLHIQIARALWMCEL